MIVSATEYDRRNSILNETVERHGIDCLLLNSRPLIKYVTGADNVCSWLFARRDGRRVALVLESDYPVYRRQSNLRDIRVFRPHDPLKLLEGVVEELDIRGDGLALEKYLKHYQYEMLHESFGRIVNLGLCAGRVMLESAILKTPQQVEKVRAACRVAVRALEVAKASIHPGMTELELMRLVEQELWRHGASAFTYVASDIRSCSRMPRRRQTSSAGDQWSSTRTSSTRTTTVMWRRTFFVDADPRFLEMYESLRQAILGTIAATRAGTRLVDIRAAYHQNLQLGPEWVTLSGPLLHGVGILNDEPPDFDYPRQARGHPSISRPALSWP